MIESRMQIINYYEFPSKIITMFQPRFQIQNPSHPKKNIPPSEYGQQHPPDLDEKPSDPHNFNSPLSRQGHATNNTLGQLTQRFVRMIQRAPDQSIEIDVASKELEIQKRRIYDITNVLQGIGYIQKLGKNKMKWVGGQRGSELENEANDLERKHESIDQETKQIQAQIQNMKSELLLLSNRNSQFNFLRIEDIITIMQSLKVTQVLLYAGQIGDQLENDSNPEKRTSQCTIESNTTQTKLYYCKLEGHNLEVTEDVSFPDPQLQPMEPIYQQKIPYSPRKLFERSPNDIFQESSESNNLLLVSPEQQRCHGFIMNLPIYSSEDPLVYRRSRREDIFENDSS